MAGEIVSVAESSKAVSRFDVGCIVLDLIFSVASLSSSSTLVPKHTTTSPS